MTLVARPSPQTIFQDKPDAFRYAVYHRAGEAQEGRAIHAVVEYPSVVRDAMKQFESVFQNQRQLEHFGEYLTGLFIAERKTVCGIKAECAFTTDPSCLNRWITEAPWHPLELNQKVSARRSTVQGGGMQLPWNI